jgi:hypothetical protein
MPLLHYSFAPKFHSLYISAFIQVC